MADIVIVNGKRTPFGKFGGSLLGVPAVDLGAHVLNAVMDDVPQIEKHEIDNVIIGLVLPGSGLSPARQAVLAAGWPLETKGLTIDRACCSSLSAIGLAIGEIKSGTSRIVMTGGMENMSRTPYLLPQIRWGQRLGDFTFQDDLIIRNAYIGAPMAKYVGDVALEKGVDRLEQDSWALRSQACWGQAQEARRFASELSPVEIETKEGLQKFSFDEHPRPNTTLEALCSLKTVYGSPTVTGGNASGIADGASAVLLCDGNLAKQRGLQPLARIIGYQAICGQPRESASMPGFAIQKLLNVLNMNLDDMKLIEINEAFAAMPLVSTLVLADFDRAKAERIREKVNVNGGAIAIGHPLGATGGRLTLTMVNELCRRGGGYGIVAICGAMGQADALVVKVD